jgi:hypothetical protein
MKRYHLRPWALAVLALCFGTPWLKGCASLSRTQDTTTGWQFIFSSLHLILSLFPSPYSLIIWGQLFGVLFLSVLSSLLYMLLGFMSCSVAPASWVAWRRGSLGAALFGHLVTILLFGRDNLAWGYWATLGAYGVNLGVEWFDWKHQSDRQ